VTLRRSLVWVVVAIALPLLVLSAILIGALDRSQRRDTRDHVLRTLRALSEAIDGELRVSLAALDVLARSPVLTDRDLPAFQEELQGTATQLGWVSAVLIDRSGQPLVTTVHALGTAGLPSLADRDYVQEVLRTGRPTISNLIPAGRLSGQPRVVLAVPVLRDGRARYVLLAGISPERLHQLLRAQTLPPGWRWGLNDRRGVIITSTSTPDPFTGQPVTDRMARASATATEGWFRNVSRDGAAVYAAFYKSPLSGWVSVALVPQAAVDGQANRTLLAMVGGALVVLAAGGFGARWLGRRLAAEVDSFRDAAVAMRHGETPALPPAHLDELRAAREALRETAERLAVQTTERCALLAEAERANAAKDEFLAMLGHELRNPLGAIIAAVALLDRIGKQDEAAVAARAIIHRQSKHLTRMVDDLLDVGRATSGKIRLDRRSVELGALVQRTLDTLIATGRAVDHRPQLSIEAVWISADPTRIAQIVVNLVENAMKFTPRGGTIRIAVRCEGDTAMLEVADTGQGIEPELLPRIFEPFTQGDQTLARSRGGLGLGLTLARRLVELHGGTIQAASGGAGQGATIAVRLPRIEPPALTPARALPAEAPVAAKRILVIDDHDDSRDTIERLLAFDGHKIIGAADGPGGIERAVAFEPDVIIVDIGLPGLDGYEVARRLRALTLPYRPRLIALTGYGQPEDRRRAEEAGFDAHLVKPAYSDTLRAAISGAPRSG
jgi:signal transduction histidine kinase